MVTYHIQKNKNSPVVYDYEYIKTTFLKTVWAKETTLKLRNRKLDYFLYLVHVRTIQYINSLPSWSPQKL